jgi:hypothetical protein
MNVVYSDSFFAALHFHVAVMLSAIDLPAVYLIYCVVAVASVAVVVADFVFAVDFVFDLSAVLLFSPEKLFLNFT